MKAAEKKEAIDFIFKKVMIYYTYLSNKYKGIPFYDQMKEIAEGAVERGNLTSLRYISKDLDGWMKDMEEEDVTKIRDLLIQNLGAAVFSDEKKETKTLDRIRKKGAIKNSKEYAIVLSRVESICMDEARKSEVEGLNTLLSDFLHMVDTKKADI
ncbi:hypothetical protein GO495_19125 [Chitinophaga oryziterrae]|uniref:Uncharacterized protein n=1 Tax=Chitinophaga oryziterrae TaxID=1031224 RepID=A0A6N8JCQ8_9BACT|nr:hypothetical protein [Chitinophaga oryziterrae]MVT42714.1 hypothetical protein [Chitinophaga oryziterrae]